MNERVQLPEVEDAEILVARYNALGLCIQDIQTEDDVTDLIFDAPGVTRLVIAPDVSQLDSDYAATVAELSESTQKTDGQFFFVTSSDMKSVLQWTGTTDLPFPVFSADDRTLKTIIRANPGLVTLKDGVIIGKEPLRRS